MSLYLNYFALLSYVQLLIILSVFKFSNNQNSSSNLQAVLNEIETEVINKANEIKTHLLDKCKDDCSKSYESCIKDDIQIQCIPSFITDKCEKCNKDTPGLMLSGVSDVKLANVYFPNVNKNEQGVKELVCSSQKAEYLLTTSANTSVRWQYIGTYNGVFRGYPGQKNCANYDPRIRPWYVGAATGAKNLILVMDISGSMNTGGKLKIAKEAAKNVISTLNNFDWVGMVTFSNVADSYKDKLQEANSENIKLLDSYIDGINASGGTNFDTGFRKAFELLNNTSNEENGTGCQTVILFLTDGKVDQDKDELLSVIQDLNQSHNAKIFTYSLGASADKRITKHISCNMNGLFENIENTLDLQKAMNSYYLLLSTGINRKNKVVWSEPYVDFFGLGTVTTAAVPIYDDSTDPPFLIGVYGADLQVKDLEKYQSYDAILEAFKLRSMVCNNFDLSACQMNSFRLEKCDNIALDCVPVRTSLETCSNSKNNVFHEAVLAAGVSEEVDLKCCGKQSCGFSTGAIVGVIIGVIVLIAVVVFICYNYCFNGNNKVNVDNKQAVGNNNNKQNNNYNHNQNHNQNQNVHNQSVEINQPGH